jgi:hypothetical protein
MRSQKLCNGDPTVPLIVSVWNYEANGDHDLYGQCETSLAEWESGEKRFEVFKVGSAIENSSIVIENFKKELKPTIGEFLRSGWVIQLGVAIDFTASNGDPNTPSSLHFIRGGDPMMRNQYEEAIMEVGSVLEMYDVDRLFPVYGFGGVPHYS